jgi:AcrR family transcriptional regulator
MLRTTKTTPRATPVRRDPDRTRQRLLRSAFEQIYRCGYQSADLHEVLERAGVTKGALYHHFENKEALGHAVIEEVLVQLTREKWLKPLEHTDNPIDGLVGIVRGTSLRIADVRGGCPLNNLAQEMSPIDEAFRKRLAKVFEEWQAGIAKALDAGKTRGWVRSDVNSREAATFLVAVYEGYMSLAKNSQDVGVLQSGIRHVVDYLESLRPAKAPTQQPTSATTPARTPRRSSGLSRGEVT